MLMAVKVCLIKEQKVKKKMLLFVLAVLLSGGLSSRALAATEGLPVQTVEGAISAVDLDAAAPWIKVQDVKVFLDHTSRGYKAGQQIPLADLKAGNQVKADMVEKDGSMFLKTLELA